MIESTNYFDFLSYDFIRMSELKSLKDWLEIYALRSNFNPFATIIVFFVDFCVCPTIVPYMANAS